jgi:beta-lactamase regulating signal transducer with metallopeptidase domain
MGTILSDSGLNAALLIVIKASCLLGAAALVQFLFRRRMSAAARHFVWTLAISSLLLLPIVSAATPTLAIEFDAGTSRMPPPLAEGSPAPPSVVVPASPTAPAQRVTPLAAAVPAIPWKYMLVAVYVGGAIALLMLLAAQHWTVQRFVRRANVLDDPAWRRLLDTSAERLGVARPVRLVESHEHRMPFTAGLRRPALVIPVAARAWPEERRRVVLLHELAHIARHDCLVQTLAFAAGALYWFHPGIWWVVRRLRVERELACDDRVLETGTAPREYAGHLLEIAYSSRRYRAPALAVAMARPHHLEGRMLAALNPALKRTVPPFHRRLAGAAMAAIVLFPLAAASPIAVAARAGDPSSHVFAPESASAGSRIPLSAPPNRTAAASSAPSSIVQEDLPGTWEIRSGGPDGTVYLRLMERNSSSGSNVPIAQLEGLTASQLTGAGGPVQFRVRRDAGTFTFEGVVRGGVGGGTFTFAPDPNFAGELAKRGFARPTPREQYQMARHDVGLAFVDELNKQGYSKPQTADLVRAGQHGVSTTYVREMGALGYKLGSLDPLIELRDHGVTPDYVRALADLGYKGLSHDDVRLARDHGVNEEYVRAMRDAGYGSLPLPALVNARDHGITADYVRELSEAGYRKLPLDQLVKVRDHGITPQYVRELGQLGYQLQLDDLVRARDHGVTVEFVREMTALGYRGQSMDALIRVRDHGVTAEYARDVKALGYEGVALDDLVSLRDHGLTVDRIKAANARAGTKLPIDLLKSLAAGGMR